MWQKYLIICSSFGENECLSNNYVNCQSFIMEDSIDSYVF